MTPNQKMPRTVYFIRAKGFDGPVKIGCTKDLPERLKAFERWSPFPLEVIAQFKGNLDIEHRLHALFEEDHLRHEWFSWSPKMAEVISQIERGTLSLSKLPDRKFVGLTKSMREWRDARFPHLAGAA